MARPKSNRGIIQCFPGHLKPRDVQKNALLKLAEELPNASVFVINLPVASGKSAIAMTIAKFMKRASIITPNKLLVDQYKSEYPAIQVLRAKADYQCTTLDVPLNKRPKDKGKPTLCKQEVGCTGCDFYRMELSKARVYPYLLSNYYIYMAHKLYRETLIVDEAHQLIATLKGMAAKKLWHFNYRFPTDIRTREEIKEWVNSLPPERFNFKWTKDGEDRKWEKQDTLIRLKDELNSTRPKYLVKVTTNTHIDLDIEEPVITMEPLDIRTIPEGQMMWPSSVNKIILMSGTISRKDIEQLGLTGKKICYIEADSPITAEQRPVFIPANGESMAYKNQNENLPKLVQYIKDLAEKNNDEKGLVHATYSLAAKLQPYFADDSRYLFHTSSNKKEQYLKFRESEEPKILIASGMYEGIDLPYDYGRWQVIAKVPYPSLADPAIKYMADLDPDYYAWETIKTVLQACGRICRTPTDYGETYIYDKTFIRLFNDNPEFFPLWFRNSVHFEGETNDTY